MAKFSKTSTQKREQGPSTEWRCELEGYTTTFASVGVDADLTPLLQGLPGDRCPSPHWGYVFKGRMWWRFGDREESVEAGEAFYAPPGHIAGADAGSEFLVFSPTETMAPIEQHMAQRAQELQTAVGS
jgi:mannose-6-phosphate isomerase-like protein (cupin superfamily)